MNLGSVSRTLLGTVSVIGTLANSSTSLAQVAVLSERTCSYDACALTLDGSAILMGAERRRVGTLGLFKASAVTPLVTERSDSAVAYAKRFDAKYNSGIFMVWSGAVVGAAATGLAFSGRDANGAREINVPLLGVAGAALVVEFTGAFRARSARQSLNKAFWWHNRDIPR